MSRLSTLRQDLGVHISLFPTLTSVEPIVVKEFQANAAISTRSLV